MDDDEERRPRRRLMMDDDDRALVGRQRRSDSSRGYPRGVPILQPETFDSFDGDEGTNPRDIFRREATEEDLELARLLGRDAGEPLTVLDFAKFLKGEQRKHREHRSGNRDLEKRLVDLLQHPPNEATAELQREMAEVKRDLVAAKRGLKVAKGIAITAISAALAAVGGWVDKMAARAETEGATAIRLQHVETRVEQLREDIIRDENQRSRQP